MSIKLIFYFFILIFSVNPISAFAKEELIFSIDLIRHGDRTPIHQIPKAYFYWKEGLGELTKKGVEQEKELGKKLRIKYIKDDHLLPDYYSEKTIYVRSTDKNRTIKSAEALLLGLYPPHTRSPFNRKIPIHVMPNYLDNLLVVRPKKANFIAQKIDNLHFELDHWRKVTGIPLTNLKQLNLLADNLRIRKLHHIPLPAGISESDANEIIAFSEYKITNSFKSKSLTAPMGNYFLKAVDNYFKLAVKHRTQLRYVLFSGHDSSIMGVMNTLQSPLEKMPSYAARLNFSLVKNANKFYVKISYNDNPIYIPACKNDVCTLHQFKRLVSESSI